MKKTFYTLFLLIIFAASFCLVGCANSASLADVCQPNAFRILRRAGVDEKIELSYVFPLNSTILKNAGAKADEIEAYKFYLTTYVNALAQNNQKKATAGSVVSNAQHFADVDGIGFTISFENLSAQKKFFGVQEDNQNSSSNIKTSGFFMLKQTLKSTFPISSARAAGDLKLVNIMAISSWSGDCGVQNDIKKAALDALQDAVFIYDFASAQSELKSEKNYQDAHGNHNFFVKTLQEIETDNSIEFYVLQPNRPIWYLAALFVVLVGVAMAFLILRAKKKK